MKKWYIIHSYSGFENQVVNDIKKKIKILNLDMYFSEIIIPKEQIVEMRVGKKRRSERKFFPGYILINMEMTNKTWHTIKKIPRVLGFVGGKASLPVAISKNEIKLILTKFKNNTNKPKPKILFEPKEVIRIIDGPFADFNGVVKDVNYEKNRLKVSVFIFGRSTSVELEFTQVEKN